MKATKYSDKQQTNRAVLVEAGIYAGLVVAIIWNWW